MIVLDVRTGDVLYPHPERTVVRAVVRERWRNFDKVQAKVAATSVGERFGFLLDYRPVNVKGRRFALALVQRKDGEGEER